MKKIYLIATALVFGSAAFGQKTTAKLKQENQISTKEVKSSATNINQKATGVTFYTNDFDTPSDWTLDNAGQTTAEFGWSIDAVSDGWWSANGINSTSGGNFAELSNGDAQAGTQVTGVEYKMTSSAPISLSTYGNNVTLSFEQYGARFNDVQQILISEDGSTFIPVGDNSNYTVLSTTGGAAYPNPVVKNINLAPYVSASATQIWVQFLWTTAFPTSASANVWITYGWYIDDLKLTSNADNDLEVIDNFVNTAGLFYYQIPVSQIAPIDFSAVVTKGTNDITNATYEVTMNPGGVVGTSPTFNLTSSVFDTVTASITPTAVGNYTVSSAFMHDSIDDIPSNNVVADVNFAVTDFIYARDNGVAAGTTTNGGDGFELGNLFDIWNDVDCWGVNVRLGTGSTLNEEFVIRLYEVDANGDFVQVIDSPPFYVESSMLNQDKIYKFANPVTLFANTTYLPVVVSPSGGVRLARAGDSEPQTTFLYDYADATWYFTTATPWVRLNLNPSLSVDETVGSISSSSVYPNPTTGNTELAFTLSNAQNVEVTVFDVSGKVMSTVALGNKLAGTHTLDINSKDFNAGVYMVNIISNDGVVTKKLIKK